MLDAFRFEVSDTDSGGEGPNELEEGAADTRSVGWWRLVSGMVHENPGPGDAAHLIVFPKKPLLSFLWIVFLIL